MHRKANTTNIIFDEQSAIALRELASNLGFFITRGPGSGNMGNIKSLLVALGKAYDADSLSTTDAIKNLVMKYKTD